MGRYITPPTPPFPADMREWDARLHRQVLRDIAADGRLELHRQRLRLAVAVAGVTILFAVITFLR